MHYSVLRIQGKNDFVVIVDVVVARHVCEVAVVEDF